MRKPVPLPANLRNMPVFQSWHRAGQFISDYGLIDYVPVKGSKYITVAYQDPTKPPLGNSMAEVVKLWNAFHSPLPERLNK